MYQNNNNIESLETLLKESLKVNPICNGRHFHRCYSSQNVPKQDVRKTRNTSTKTSQNVHRKQPALVKYPLRNIPIGLEQPPKLKAPKQKEQSSTMDFIEKLKQIDTKHENATFLEQANEEINVAFKQLQEIQKLIARKLNTDPNTLQDAVTEEDGESQRRHNCSIVDSCNKQIERMQKKYLNKTKIHYKSLQDFENVTLAGETRSSRQTNQLPQGKQVEVLYAKNKISGETFTPKQINKELKKAVTVSDEQMKRDKVQKMDGRIFIQNLDADKIRSLLKTDDIVENIKRRNENAINNSKIRYLLKPELSAETNEYKTSVAEAVQTDNERTESRLISPRKFAHFTAHAERQNRGKFRRVTFEDRKFQQSILNYDSISSSTSTEDLDIFTDSQSEYQNVTLQTGNVYLKPRYQRKLQKIDESIMTSDNLISKNVEVNLDEYVEGREKLNLLLHGKKKLCGKLDDSEIADSVIKSAYLSKEFGVDVKGGFPKVSKDGPVKKSSMHLVEAVVNKFRNQLQPKQLANLKGRDWKLYSKLTSALENTLFTEIRK